MDLATAINLYFAEKWDLAETTRTTYRYHLRHFTDYIGNPSIDDIRPTDIKRYLAHIIGDVGLSRRTASDHWICLSSIFTWAEESLAVEHPIKGKVQRPRFNKEPVDILTENEVRALLKWVSHTTYTRNDGKVIKVRRQTPDRDRAIILTLIDVGLRASELCALTMADFTPQRGGILIRDGKGRHGGKSRRVFVGRSAKSAIIRYCAYRDKPRDADPLFATSSGNHMNRNNLGHMLKTVSKAAGVRQAGKGVYPHLFRHTMAVNFLRNGGDIRTLQDILGHESLETVSEYLRLAERDVEAAAEFSAADKWRL